MVLLVTHSNSTIQKNYFDNVRISN